MLQGVALQSFDSFGGGAQGSFSANVVYGEGRRTHGVSELLFVRNIEDPGILVALS